MFILSSDHQHHQQHTSMSAFIPLSKRSEWSDIEPIPQKDPADPVVAIDYPDECKLVVQRVNHM